MLSGLDPIRPLDLIQIGVLISFCQSVVFIPDLAQTCRETWKIESSKDSFWPDCLPNNFDISTFDYELTDAKHLANLVIYKGLESLALRLLHGLHSLRTTYSGRSFAPILVGHGFGGLISELV